jgi:hypothetical protein
MLEVADNSGARKLQCILPRGGDKGLTAGLGDIITKGAAAGGFSPSSITSLKSVTDAAGKMGVNPSQISALAGYVTNSMSSAGGTSAANLLSSVWR